MIDENKFPNIFDEPSRNESSDIKISRKFRRSKSDFIVAGTCAGIAKYFHVDVSVIRVIAILSLLLGLWSVAVYIITSIIMPQEILSEELSEIEINSKRKINQRTILGGSMIFFGFYYGFNSIGYKLPILQFILPASYILPILLFGLGFFFFTNRKIEMGNKIPERNFYSEKENRLILGVCRGLSNYLDVDINVVRAFFITSSVLTLGLFIAVYFLIGVLTHKISETKNDR